MFIVYHICLFQLVSSNRAYKITKLLNYLAGRSETLCKIRISSFKNWTSHHFSNGSFVCIFFLQILRHNIYKLTCFVHHGIIMSPLFNLRKYHISQFSNDDGVR